MPFEGRLAHQTLGMLLTRQAGAGKGAATRLSSPPIMRSSIWGLRDMGRMFKKGELPLSELFDEDMLGDDLEAWLSESFMLKRTFRNCALISGLVEKRHPGQEKTGRQVTVSTDLDLRCACGSMSRITFSFRQPAPMRRPDLLDIRAPQPICWAESKAISSIRIWTRFRRWPFQS